VAERIVTEASTLGFAPGEWPGETRHNGATYRLLRRADIERNGEGEVVAVTYRKVAAEPGLTLAADADVLVVLND
jgi:hypothetical protein